MQRQIANDLEGRIGSDEAYRLLHAYWLDRSVQRQGQQVIAVDMLPRKHLWMHLCREVQRKLIRRVEQGRIVVEVNPSSNRVIGPMARLSQHHIFRMTLDSDKRLLRNIRVTVNTDDPGVFNTSLAHEYYLLAEVLLRRRVPEAEVLEWLEWLRKNGEDYSFVNSIPGLDDKRMKRLLKSLRWRNRALLPHLRGLRRKPNWSVLAGRPTPPQNLSRLASRRRN